MNVVAVSSRGDAQRANWSWHKDIPGILLSLSDRKSAQAFDNNTLVSALASLKNLYWANFALPISSNDHENQ